MPVTIIYQKDVSGVLFTISGHKNPKDAIAEDSLLKQNLISKGIVIEPYLSTDESLYLSGSCCQVVKVKNFSSIEDLKARALEGFTQHISTDPTSEPGHLQYKFEGEDAKELTAYFKHKETSEQKASHGYSTAQLAASMSSTHTQPKQASTSTLLPKEAHLPAPAPSSPR